MVEHPDAGRVDLFVLPACRLGVLRLRGDVRTEQVLAEIGRVQAERPESMAYNCVTDLRQHTGHLGVPGIAAVLALRFADPASRTPSREVLLTADPGMVFLARYLDLLAPHVEHSVSADPLEACTRAMGGPPPEEALAFLRID